MRSVARAVQNKKPSTTQTNLLGWNYKTQRPSVEASYVSPRAGRYSQIDEMSTGVKLHGATFVLEWGNITPTQEDIAGFYWLHKYPSNLKDFQIVAKEAYLKHHYEQVSKDLEQMSTQLARAKPWPAFSTGRKIRRPA